MVVAAEAKLGGVQEPGNRFEGFFTTQRLPMHRLAHLLTNGSPHAEEVVLDAFLEVYRRWEDLDAPVAYLRRCVVNGSHRHNRRRHLMAAAVPWLRREPAPPQYDDTLEAVNRLTDRQRSLIVLRYYCDLSQEEIAATLGIPVGTVKSGLHRALASLREVIEQ